MNGETRANQDSLRMREARDLIGRWTVTGDTPKPGDRCDIMFLNERIEFANAWKLAGSENCLNKVFSGVVGWRPAPDGIEFASADGRTVVMFDANGEARGATGESLRLARAAD